MNKTKIWKFGKTTGLWNFKKEVLSENKDAYLAIFKKEEPNEFFVVSKRKPSKMPY